MQLNTLKSAYGATKKRKRLGRGQGSGKGGTATRGHKGAQSRSGYRRKRGFEGGQLPLQRRLPRYGFKNYAKIVYKPISLRLLQQLADEEQLTSIDSLRLAERGLISQRSRYKVLGDGVLRAKLRVYAHAFSASARAAIESAGGQAIIITAHD